MSTTPEKFSGVLDTEQPDTRTKATVSLAVAARPPSSIAAIRAPALIHLLLIVSS